MNMTNFSWEKYTNLDFSCSPDCIERCQNIVDSVTYTKSHEGSMFIVFALCSMILYFLFRWIDPLLTEGKEPILTEKSYLKFLSFLRMFTLAMLFCYYIWYFYL